MAALRWDDLHLHVPRPFVTVRASTTKNHRAATLWLRDDGVADALDKLPRFDDVAAAMATGTDGEQVANDGGKILSQIVSQSGVCSGHGQSHAVAKTLAVGSAKTMMNTGKIRSLTPAVASSREGAKSAPTRART